MKTKKFSELRNKMTPEQKAESEVQSKIILLHLTLAELRESLERTQTDVAKDMGIVQSALSKIEHQDESCWEIRADFEWQTCSLSVAIYAASK